MKYYTYGFDGLTIPRKSDAPKYERPPGADERDLREAEEKRRRRAEKARVFAEALVERLAGVVKESA